MLSLPQWTRAGSRSSALPLALFRILFGLCLVFDIVALIEYAPMWFDDVPWIEERAAWIDLALYVWLGAAICLAFGAFSTVAAVLNYAGCVTFMSFHAMPLSYEYHLDNLYLVTSFVLPFLPIGRALSVDAWRRPPADRTIGPGAEIFFALVVSSIYFDSALWKLGSSMWMHGLGYWTTAVQPWEGQPSFAWTLNHEWVARAAGYATLVFELVFVFLIWFRPLRWPLLIMGFTLHIGIGTVLPIPLFGLIMVSFLAALIPVRAPALTEEQRLAPAPKKSIGARLAPAYLALWGVVFTMGLIDPLLAISREGLGGSKTTHQRFWYAKAETPFERSFGSAVFWIYRVFGFRSHPIFIDSQFSLCSHQARLRFHPGDGGSTADEVFDFPGEGTSFHPPHYNRRFLAMYYRSVWAHIPLDHVEVRLTRFLNYHAGAGSFDRNGGWIAIEQRPIEMPVDRWVHGQRAANEAQPWTRVGVAKPFAQGFEFSWREPSWPDSEGAAEESGDR